MASQWYAKYLSIYLYIYIDSLDNQNHVYLDGFADHLV